MLDFLKRIVFGGGDGALDINQLKKDEQELLAKQTKHIAAIDEQKKNDHLYDDDPQIQLAQNESHFRGEGNPLSIFLQP